MSQEKNMPRFATLISCICGQIQHAQQLIVKHSLFTEYAPDFLDTITLPGPDKVLSELHATWMVSLMHSAATSVAAHNSSLIIVVGHEDCAANPVSEEEHKAQIREAVKVVRSWELKVAGGSDDLVKVAGMWLFRDPKGGDNKWRGEIVV